MISDKDTTKQDIALVVIAVLAAMLFYWLYSTNHPLGLADLGYGKIPAAQKSAEILQIFGYSSNIEPVTRFRVDSELLDTLQADYDIDQFYSDRKNKTLFPSFHWSTQFKIDELDTEGFFGVNAEKAKTIEVKLSEDGSFLGFINNYNIIPDKNADIEALTYALQEYHTVLPQIRTDSLIYQMLQFQFSELELEDDAFSGLNSESRNYFGKKIAENIASYYLENSGWPSDIFNIEDVEKVSLGSLDAAAVTFTSDEAAVDKEIELILKVLPTGTLVAFDFSHLSELNPTVDSDEIKSVTRTILLLLGTFWILILLFIRFRLRLIDTKSAVLIAVLAGFIYPFILLLNNAHSHIYSFGEFNGQFVLMQLISIGFFISFASIGYFIVTAIGESITRQHWVEKMRTMDLIRIGHFFNRPVGQTFIRGISYSLIISAGWALSVTLLPGSYFSLETYFLNDSRFLPYLDVFLGNLALYFLITQIIFLIVLGQFKSVTNSVFYLLLIAVITFVLMNPVPVDVGPISFELVSAGVVGLIAGIIYFKDDFLTTFIALFFFACHLLSANGWVVNNSPDSSVFYTVIIVMITGFIYGVFGIYKGRSIRELPKFVPEYIDELAQEERIKQELQIARKVQQSFLPIRTPELKGLEIAAVCKPAYETGGDYYDFISLDEHRMAVAIGDVSGKGIEAAFYMTFTKGVLHALCNDFKSTIDVLIKANNLFSRNARRGTFISLIFGVMDSESANFRFSRAGHNPLLYYKKSERKLTEYQPEGIGLGLAPQHIFENHISEMSIDLKSGDILVLFTDGVVEATSKTDDFYGDKRLHSLIENYNELGAEELLNRIIDDLVHFGDQANQHDDMTLLIIKKK
ncbi:MAG: PP2C family protein-serine/threonine phosphatase [Balneolaceae bacterium]